MAATTWKQGDRVITPFRGSGSPMGIVVSVEVSADDDSPSIGETEDGTEEWVKVRFDDGREREYAAWDLSEAPE